MDLTFGEASLENHKGVCSELFKALCLYVEESNIVNK